MKTEKWTENQIKCLLLVGVLLLMMGILCLWVAPHLTKIADEAERIREWVREYRILGRLAFMGIVMLQVFLAVLPGEPLEIAGGYIFGALEGTVLCLVAAALGSLMVFSLVRRFGLRLVNLFFADEKMQKLHFLHSSPRRLFLFMIIFMIPGTPKDLLSYYAGLTDIKLPVFLLICSLGRIPSLVTSTIGGDALGMKSYLFAAVVFAATLIVSVGGLLLYEYICKHQGKKQV